MDTSEIGREIEKRQKEGLTAGKFFDYYIDLSAGEREDENAPVNLRIGEFSGLEEIPGCNPIKDLGGPLGSLYKEGEAKKIIEAVRIITRDLAGLDRQLRQWEELKRAIETREWSAGHRRYAGVRGSKSILKELESHLNRDNELGNHEIKENKIHLMSGGSTAALHFLTDMFGTVAYGYPGYLYNIHAGFKSNLIGFEAWSLEELVSSVMEDRERLSVRAAIINVPHNPLAYNLTEDSLKPLHELSKYVKLIFDNVYGQYDHKAMELLSQIKNKIILRSFSKEFGMPGLRFSYLIFDNTKEKEKMEVQSSAAYVSIQNPILLLAKWVLQFNRNYGLSEHIVKQMNKRQSDFENGIKDKGNIADFGVTFGNPEGMYRILYLDKGLVSAHPGKYNSHVFVKKCKEEGVIVTPIEVFAPPYAAGKLDRTGIRIAVSGSPRAYEGGKRVLAAAENMHNKTRN